MVSYAVIQPQDSGRDWCAPWAAIDTAVLGRLRGTGRQGQRRSGTSNGCWCVVLSFDRYIGSVTVREYTLTMRVLVATTKQAKHDRVPLFVAMGLGSFAALVALVLQKPKKVAEKKDP